MEVTYQSPPTPPASVETLIAAVQLSQPDLDSIKSVRSRLGLIAEIDGRCHPDRAQQSGQEWRSFSHLRVDEILLKLGENPTHELAEQAHSAIIRAKFASESCQPISAALRSAVTRESRSLESVALRVLDMAEAAMHQEAAAHRATLSEAGGLFGGDGAAALDGKVAQLVRGFEAERAEAQRDPGHWLLSRGIGEELPEPPPAPAPMPEVKAPRRGRVELPASDLATEMAGDFH